LQQVLAGAGKSFLAAFYYQHLHANLLDHKQMILMGLQLNAHTHMLTIVDIYIGKDEMKSVIPASSLVHYCFAHKIPRLKIF
jgi:hypothetical protein